VVVDEGRDGDFKVARRGAFADAAGGVVMRAVAGAEPAAEIAGAVADRHAAQMGADADHHQPFAGFVHGAVLVVAGSPGLFSFSRPCRSDRSARHGAGGLDLLGGAAADEHGLAQPFDRQLGADLDPLTSTMIEDSACTSAEGFIWLIKGPGGGAGRDGAGTRPKALARLLASLAPPVQRVAAVASSRRK
jgi:hypothetical protein